MQYFGLFYKHFRVKKNYILFLIIPLQEGVLYTLVL